MMDQTALPPRTSTLTDRTDRTFTLTASLFFFVTAVIMFASGRRHWMLMHDYEAALREYTAEAAPFPFSLPHADAEDVEAYAALQASRALDPSQFRVSSFDAAAADCAFSSLDTVTVTRPDGIEVSALLRGWGRQGADVVLLSHSTLLPGFVVRGRRLAPLDAKGVAAALGAESAARTRFFNIASAALAAPAVAVSAVGYRALCPAGTHGEALPACRACTAGSRSAGGSGNCEPCASGLRSAAGAASCAAACPDTYLPVGLAACECAAAQSAPAPGAPCLPIVNPRRRP